MPTRVKRIAHAWLESPTTGVVELTKDWRAKHPPPVSVNGVTHPGLLHRVPDFVFGQQSAYFVNRKHEIFFVLCGKAHPEIDATKETIYLSGDFNGWAGLGHEAWALEHTLLAGEPVWLWSGPALAFFTHPLQRFKFVTSSDRWLPVPATAPNAVRDGDGNVNYTVDPDRTGQHLFRFTLPSPVDLSQSSTVRWAADGEDAAQVVTMMPGDFFQRLRTDLPLGALVRGRETVFRLFAPRAASVTLHLTVDPAVADRTHTYALTRRPDEPSVWEVTLGDNLHGWAYWYHLDGPKDAFSAFAPERRVLDPYALATLGREGPGLIVDRAWLGEGDRGFATPAWQDLVIAEAHVRDLTAAAPVALSTEERRGFAGLRQWVESPDFYLHSLGVNCVELQPIQEFDNVTIEEYHWGYMTTNFFAPESAYALSPQRASGLKEFQALVAAFHRRGMAVLLDVVYNHVGEPAHLLAIDKLYYFEQDRDGRLSNWSGCGNDLRASAAMATRLIIDSCTHLIEAYGVDGFRFDLADLVGASVLREVEVALKRIKPDVVLIAEPWSFRGHIAGELRDTGWASWNDGYRNFVRDYVRGGASRESFEYYLKGSPWYYAKWPAQTVNYTESHDDRTWIDVITENPDNNGFVPTPNDRRRTHLMGAILFSSIGIPMLSAGQDFLRSKHGVNNTYLRGDLNALDYRRLQRYSGSHAYFAGWIAFRRSEAGRLLRHFSRAGEGFFRFYWAEHSAAAAVVYNADGAQGPVRLLFAVNPTLNDVTIHIGPEIAHTWVHVADHERFLTGPHAGMGQRVEPDLWVPALGCGLWRSEG